MIEPDASHVAPHDGLPPVGATGTPLVLIVDDVGAAHTILRDAVVACAPAAIFLHAASLAEAEPLLGRPFTLALIDLDLPDGRGSGLIRRLRTRPELIVAAVTVMDDDASIEDALAAGANGYLLKDAEPNLLAMRIERLLAGEPSLSPAIARRVLARFAGVPDQGTAALSPREREVLGMVARGLRSGEVASVLGISRHTVRDHVKSIYAKLGVTSRAEVALEAKRLRLA